MRKNLEKSELFFIHRNKHIEHNRYICANQRNLQETKRKSFPQMTQKNADGADQMFNQHKYILNNSL